IGRVCTMALARSSGRMVLIARNRDRLEALRDEVGSACPIEIAVNPLAARAARVLITAASAAAPVLTAAELAPGTIACDVGYPKNLSATASAREDVLVFSGGLAKLTGPIDLQSYTRLPSADLLHGCFCEAVVLAARQENLLLSTAQEAASVHRAEEVLAAA